MSVIFSLFAECVGQAREPAHRHTHGQVLPFGISCIPSFRFSYIEAKGLRGRLGVDAKAQANLPDV